MEGRSQKDGSRFQVVLMSRDESSTKPSFEKILGIFSFSLFTSGNDFHPLQSGDRVEPHFEQG